MCAGRRRKKKKIKNTNMKHIPILFSTPMAQAINQGYKTETRRLKKLEKINIRPNDWAAPVFCKQTNQWVFTTEYGQPQQIRVKCPYGQTDDILWVRETFREYECYETENTPHFGQGYEYLADPHYCESCDKNKWKPSIYMPKAACRTWMQITDIRLDRLHNITAREAINEGVNVVFPVSYNSHRFKDYLEPTSHFERPEPSFASLWASINGFASYDANPWVWVIKFQKTDMPPNFI